MIEEYEDHSYPQNGFSREEKCRKATEIVRRN
jgi:hypothetical protein